VGSRQAKRLVLAAGALIVASAVVAGVLLARDNGPARTTGVGSAAGSPGLTLRGKDPITGKPVSLAQYKGRPVVINMWASWCPGCYREADDLARFAAAHPEAVVVGVNVRDSISGARRFYRRYAWKFPSIADRSGRIAASLRLQGMPTTVFLDARHREVARIIGETDLAGFTEGLERATGRR
jgi:thiol-disulfide isomerase/thioredoxin